MSGLRLVDDLPAPEAVPLRQSRTSVPPVGLDAPLFGYVVPENVSDYERVKASYQRLLDSGQFGVAALGRLNSWVPAAFAVYGDQGLDSNTHRIVAIRQRVDEITREAREFGPLWFVEEDMDVIVVPYSWWATQILQLLQPEPPDRPLRAL